MDLIFMYFMCPYNSSISLYLLVVCSVSLLCNIPLYEYTCLPSLLLITFSLFSAFVYYKQTAMSILIYILWWMSSLISLEQTCLITRQFSRYCPIIFQSGFYQFVLPSVLQELPTGPATSSPTLSIVEDSGNKKYIKDQGGKTHFSVLNCAMEMELSWGFC